MRAADFFEQGVIPAEVARRVGVSHQIVSDWRAVWRRSGRAGLRGAGRAGRLPKLSRDQLAQVEVELAKGAELIERLTGVAYHPAHVWHILRYELNWSWQRPARRAREWNEEAIRHWVNQRWPRLKTARRQHALIVFEDESGVSLLPSVRATWAARGRTPVLRHRFVWKRLSVAGAWPTNPMAAMLISSSNCVLVPTTTSCSSSS
ncbi:MAG: winged helix-turn-helix domain-containing protein [Chloroflexi bacterium]|nr:winged helix-turn-helix domain-containing protein [Chloroflexota bacterium]